MSTRIRLRRMGANKRPFYRVVVADQRSPRDGRFIENIGKYHPLEDPSLIEIDQDRALHWLRVGAQPSDQVRNLMVKVGIWDAFVAERVGIIRTVVLTELATACGIALIALGPLGVALGVLLPLGIALNGTSSALYATVADLVLPERRARAYGLYYTLVVSASAAAPLVYGALGDAMGVVATLLVTSAVVLSTVPLCLVLRGALSPLEGARQPA